MALTQVASPDTEAELFAATLADWTEEQQPDSDDLGDSATPVQATDEEDSRQEPEPEAATPTLVAEHEQRVASLERARRQEQGRADSATQEAQNVRTFATNVEREMASVAAERDFYLRILEAEGVQLTAEQKRMIQLEAANAANTHQSKAPAPRQPQKPPTAEEIAAGREQDRQTLIGLGRELGVDLSKVDNLGLDLVANGDTPAFLRHYASLLVAPYKKALANQPPAESASARRVRENRVPRQSGSGASMDWKNRPIHELDAEDLIKQGLDEDERRR